MCLFFWSSCWSFLGLFSFLGGGVYIQHSFRSWTPFPGRSRSARPLPWTAIYLRRRFRCIRGLLVMNNLGSSVFAERGLDLSQWHSSLSIAGWFALLAAWKHRGQFLCMELTHNWSHSTKTKNSSSVNFTFTAGQEHTGRFLWRPRRHFWSHLLWDIKIKHSHINNKYQLFIYCHKNWPPQITIYYICAGLNLRCLQGCRRRYHNIHGW